MRLKGYPTKMMIHIVEAQEENDNYTILQCGDGKER